MAEHTHTSDRKHVCPYCGCVTTDQHRCPSCRGLFDPLSRQATQNAMGPWFIRDQAQPFRPGCSLETLYGLIDRGKVTTETIIRGPSTRQFWMPASWCPGVAHRLGICHSCQAEVSPADLRCAACGASFVLDDDRQVLGLGDIRPLPGCAAPRPANSRSGMHSHAVEDEPVGVEHQPVRSEVSQVPAVPTHFERELRKARRFGMAFFLACCVLVLVLGGMLIVPRLDLDEGPLSGYFGNKATPSAVRQPDLPDEVAPIVTGPTDQSLIHPPALPAGDGPDLIHDDENMGEFTPMTVDSGDMPADSGSSRADPEPPPLETLDDALREALHSLRQLG